MSTALDLELFLAGVLTGSHATRQRHLRQAKTIQAAITERWQRKHLAWFLVDHLSERAESTRYY